MRRSLSLAIAGAACTAAAAFPVSASAAPAGGGCALQGTAKFAPNGPGTSSSFGYSFSGALSNCESNVSAPATGSISAGNIETIAGQTYQEPAASGTGQVPGNSCAAGTTSGTAIVTWAGGTHTVISYTTQSAGAGVALSGVVIPSVVLQPTSPTGTPVTVSTDSPWFPVGDTANGVLAFEVTSPTQCNTAAGVTTAGIAGAVGVGATS